MHYSKLETQWKPKEHTPKTAKHGPGANKSSTTMTIIKSITSPINNINKLKTPLIPIIFLNGQDEEEEPISVEDITRAHARPRVISCFYGKDIRHVTKDCPIIKDAKERMARTTLKQIMKPIVHTYHQQYPPHYTDK